MKTPKFIRTIIALITIVAVAFPAMAHDFEVDGIYYKITSETDSEIAVTYKGYVMDDYLNVYFGDIVIPEHVTYSGKTYTVTKIGYRAFKYNDGLKSVIIPSTVTEIDYVAFEGCTGLASVTIANSVISIGESAFSGCTSLTSITIPNSLTSIGSDAFYGCTGLTSITIPNSVTSIGSDAFKNTGYWNNQPDGIIYLDNCLIGYKGDKSNLSGALVIDSKTRIIGDSAFSGCTGLTSVTIPNSVTSIGKDAFSGCTWLTSVTIPESVTSIDFNAFSGCTGLKEVHITDIAAWCKIHFYYVGTIYYASSNPLCYAGNLYLNDNLITDLVIPESVTTINAYSFFNCKCLTSVTIPNSVTSIGNNAFSECTGLKEVHITDVAAWCKIDFNSDSDANPLYYAKNLYLNDKLITDLVIPESVTAINAYSFFNCECLTSVTIPNSVTSIGSDAFYGCTGLTSVTIPNSVTSIGGYAFYGCTGLTSVTIPNSVTSIGGYAFYGCTGLTSVTIPEAVTSIGSGAFGCSNLKYVYYNAKNANSISSDIFEYYGNSGYSYPHIEHIVIGKDVQSIPSKVFTFYRDYSNSTKTIVSQNPVPPVCSDDAFYSVDKSQWILYVPAASYADYWTADVWKDFKTIKPFTTEISALSLDNVTIETNEDIQLDAKITPADASIKDLIWTSSNPAVATVSKTGMVHGVTPGEATITAMTIDGSNLAASCKVTVEEVKAKSITLSQTTAQLAPYESVVLKYTILPENTSDKSVTWTSSDQSVATFRANDDGSATVLMLKEGVAIITATTNDGSNLSASCLIGETDGVLILDNNNVTLAKNEWVTLTATVLPDDIEAGDVAWSVDDNTVVRVIDNGDNTAMLLALSEGDATVTATATTTGGKVLTAQCQVSVSFSGVESIEADACKVSVENGAIVVKNATGEVTVHNLTGIGVASEQADGNNVRIEGLQHGVYIVTVNGKATKVVL